MSLVQYVCVVKYKICVRGQVYNMFVWSSIHYVCVVQYGFGQKQFLCSRGQNHTQRIKWAYIWNAALLCPFSEPNFYSDFFLVKFFALLTKIISCKQYRFQEIILLYVSEVKT